MFLAGIVGALFAYVNIPLVYIFVGLVCNIFYTFLGPLDLIFKAKTKRDISIKIFSVYFCLTATVVIFAPLALTHFHLKS